MGSGLRSGLGFSLGLGWVGVTGQISRGEFRTYLPYISLYLPYISQARPQSVVALLAAHAPLASTQSWLQRFLFLSQFEQVRLM